MSPTRPPARKSDGLAPCLSWFCVWQAETLLKLEAGQLDALRALLQICPGLRAGHVLLPARAHDPYYPSADGSPSLIVQLEFHDLALLEEHLQADGHLAPLADPEFLSSLAGAWPAQQAMLTRRYPVENSRIRNADGPYVSYWVEYAGPAADPNAWHVHYNAHHPQLLAGFPGIRAIEIYTPAVVACELPLPERPCLQRNKTVFDDVDAMNAAMQSPVREALREDFRKLPAFQGPALHFPFLTLTCRPATSTPA